LQRGLALCEAVTATGGTARAAAAQLPRAENDMRAEFLAALAAVRQGQGRLPEALHLYAQLFARRPLQPVPVWHTYIRSLFHAGRFEDGVQAILACARQHGISSRDVQRDFTLQDACRHWLHFEPLDIMQWYEILGEQLAREELSAGKEALLALLINTRGVLKQVYPEYFALQEDDLAALRARLEDERTNTAARAGSRPAERGAHGETREEGAARRGEAAARGAAAPPGGPGRLVNAGASNVIVEDAVNAALAALQENMRRGRDEPGPWLELLRQFPSNLLAETVVDGVSAHGLIYQVLGSVYSYSERRSNAIMWLERAKGEAGLYGNRGRLGEAVMWLADNYAAIGRARQDDAEHYCGWAEELCASNWYLAARVAAVRARLAARRGDLPSAMRILRQAIDAYGESVPQVVYERLARMHYQRGEHRAGFAVYVEGLKRTKCKMELGMWNHMIDGFFMNRSLHTAEELRRVRELLRACVLRYPAVVENAPAQARLLRLADAAWIDEHMRLAEIAAAGAYTDENWQFISNCVAAAPSVRAGLLYMDAQAARDPRGTNAFDWRGWVAAWESVGNEQRPGRADSPTDSGGYEALNAVLIAQVERHAGRLDGAGAAMIASCVRQRMGRLGEEGYERLVRVLKPVCAAEQLVEVEQRRAELRQRYERGKR